MCFYILGTSLIMAFFTSTILKTVPRAWIFIIKEPITIHHKRVVGIVFAHPPRHYICYFVGMLYL